MAKVKLTKQEIERLNRDLRDCKDIKDDLARAKAAGVPNIEHLEDAVKHCEERIASIKQQYAPKER